MRCPSWKAMLQKKIGSHSDLQGDDAVEGARREEADEEADSGAAAAADVAVAVADHIEAVVADPIEAVVADHTEGAADAKRTCSLSRKRACSLSYEVMAWSLKLIGQDKLESICKKLPTLWSQSKFGKFVHLYLWWLQCYNGELT